MKPVLFAMKPVLFTAGINDEQDGLLGSINPAP
jgi:hypothetical protein